MTRAEMMRLAVARGAPTWLPVRDAAVITGVRPRLIYEWLSDLKVSRTWSPESHRVLVDLAEIAARAGRSVGRPRTARDGQGNRT